MSTNAMPPINTASTEQANWVFDWLSQANVKLQLLTSGVVPFATELDAYRHANGTTMEVVLVPWGSDVQRADVQ